jgi:hypothetical protein
MTAARDVEVVAAAAQENPGKGVAAGARENPGKGVAAVEQIPDRDGPADSAALLA